MVIFTEVKDKNQNVSDVVRFHSSYTTKNSITPQTVKNLNSFINKALKPEEIQSFVSNINVLTSVLRALLVESIYYNTEGKNESGKLNVMTRQEDIDAPNYIQLFIHSTNLRELIGVFIINNTKIKDVSFLETLFLIILNHILCVAFNNAVQDIKTTNSIDVCPNEYNRLIFKFYRKYYRDGWLNVIKYYMRLRPPAHLDDVLHSVFTNILINIPFESMFDQNGFDTYINRHILLSSGH